MQLKDTQKSARRGFSHEFATPRAWAIDFVMNPSGFACCNPQMNQTFDSLQMWKLPMKVICFCLHSKWLIDWLVVMCFECGSGPTFSTQSTILYRFHVPFYESWRGRGRESRIWLDKHDQQVLKKTMNTVKTKETYLVSYQYEEEMINLTINFIIMASSSTLIAYYGSLYRYDDG